MDHTNLIDHTVYELRDSCLEKLNKIHPHMKRVVEEAREIADIDFIIAEGQRNTYRQRRLWYKGEASNETGPFQYGMAVHLVAQLDGMPCFSINPYIELATAMRFAAQNLGIPIQWGGLKSILNLTKTDPTQDLEGLVFNEQFVFANDGKVWKPCFQLFIISVE